MFIEALRQHMGEASARSGWLTAAADPILGRCIAAIHKAPHAEWMLETLSDAACVSRSVLAERFQKHLGISPVRYVRDGRLHLASLALVSSPASVTEIAVQGGCGSGAAFTRAFARAYGSPRAACRNAHRQQ